MTETKGKEAEASEPISTKEAEWVLSQPVVDFNQEAEVQSNLLDKAAAVKQMYSTAGAAIQELKELFNKTK